MEEVGEKRRRMKEDRKMEKDGGTWRKIKEDGGRWRKTSEGGGRLKEN
jgi:hypothetical protein